MVGRAKSPSTRHISEEAMKQPTMHGIVLKSFLLVMIAHWIEHGVQAYQVYVLGFERHHVLGLLGHSTLGSCTASGCTLALRS